MLNCSLYDLVCSVLANIVLSISRLSVYKIYNERKNQKRPSHGEEDHEIMMTTTEGDDDGDGGGDDNTF